MRTTQKSPVRIVGYPTEIRVPPSLLPYQLNKETGKIERYRVKLSSFLYNIRTLGGDVSVKIVNFISLIVLILRTPLHVGNMQLHVYLAWSRVEANCSISLS
jgi:hypothetical protein